MVEVIWRTDDWLCAGSAEAEDVLTGIAVPGGRIERTYGFENTTILCF